VASSSTAPECIAFIQARLAHCHENHEDCKSLEREKSRPKRLLKIDGSIDTVKIILLETVDTSYKYVALSHCWGPKHDAAGNLNMIPRTTKANLGKHISHGLPGPSLTKTFRDVLDVTRKLGIEYIWIDSLCIVQDDQEDKIQELPRMGSIYGGAYLVVAATLAENGDHGLHRERQQRLVQFRTLTNEMLKAAVYEKSHHDVWKKGEQFWAEPELPLFGRAWAFQERLLAKRVVHFTPSELVWECFSSIECECGDLQSPHTSSPEFGKGKNLKTKYRDIVRWGSDMDRINFWHDICAQYSARQISYVTDRLPALSSVARQIDMSGLLGKYLAGIWECTLPGGLLWWSEYTNPSLYPVGTKTHRRIRPPCVPTWSWLSVEGRVSTWGRCWMSLVCILHIHYTTSGNDPYGQCTEGAISILGQAVAVEVVNAKRGDGPSDKEVRIPGRDDSFDFTTDTSPFELSDEDLKTSALLALRFAAGSHPFVHAIILRLVPGPGDRYERLGIATCPNEWFVGQTPRKVILI
jgi:hypothetical protein